MNAINWTKISAKQSIATIDGVTYGAEKLTFKNRVADAIIYRAQQMADGRWIVADILIEADTVTAAKKEFAALMSEPVVDQPQPAPVNGEPASIILPKSATGGDSILGVGYVSDYVYPDDSDLGAVNEGNWEVQPDAPATETGATKDLLAEAEAAWAESETPLHYVVVENDNGSFTTFSPNGFKAIQTAMQSRVEACQQVEPDMSKQSEVITAPAYERKANAGQMQAIATLISRHCVGRSRDWFRQFTLQLLGHDRQLSELTAREASVIETRLATIARTRVHSNHLADAQLKLNTYYKFDVYPDAKDWDRAKKEYTECLSRFALIASAGRTNNPRYLTVYEVTSGSDTCLDKLIESAIKPKPAVVE